MFIVVLLIVLMLLFRIPYLSGNLPLLSSELEWYLIGEKLNLNLDLYSEILTKVGPLAAYVYKFLNLIFGKNQFLYETLAGVLLFLQALYLNYMVNRRNLFNEKNYLVALIFVVVAQCSFDFTKLSPSLMANIFIMLSLNAVLRQIEKREGGREDIFEAGLYIGIATLLSLSSFIFIFWVLFALFFYTSTNIRQAFMVIVSFLFPIFFMYLFFYFNNTSDAFLNIWLYNLTPSFKITWLGLRDVIIAYTIPIALAALGILRVLRGNRYNNFQNRSHQIIIIFSLFCLSTLFLGNNLFPNSLIYLIIPITFFISGFFIHARQVIILETMFMAFLGSVLILAYAGNGIFGSNNFEVLKDYKIKKGEVGPELEGKRIYVTGEKIDGFQSNPVATGYLSWSLAKKDFENPNNYMSMVNIQSNFNKDMPEVIIDKENVMPKVFANLPFLKNKYVAKGKNTYFLIK